MAHPLNIFVSAGEDETGLRMGLDSLLLLRWLAVLCIVVTTFSTWALGLIEGLWQPLGVALVLGLFNAILWFGRRHGRPFLFHLSRSWSYRSVAFWELHVDLLALTMLLHYTGGAENPFSLFYLFPLSLGSILLGSARASLALGLSACLMLGGMAWGEYAGVLEHNPLIFDLSGKAPVGTSPMHESPLLILGDVFTHWVTIIGVVLCLQAVVKGQRRAEEERRKHEQIALSRERLARVGEISAGLAHSIRNPLHGVLTCIELLPVEEMDANDQENIALMREALYRIEGVTKRLLDLAREAPLATELTSLSELVSELCSMLKGKAERGGVDLIPELGDLPEIPMDPNRIHEALFNIVDNAIQACEGMGGGRVVVRAFRRSEEPKYVFLEVDDSGPGIPPEDQAKIFHPFFTTKAIGEGTGLGLAITKRVIEAHAGRITIESKVDQGTCVRIRLPIDSALPNDQGGQA